MEHTILVINPGSTSTKIAVYQNQQPLFTENVEHGPGELVLSHRIADQLPFRRKKLLEVLAQKGFDCAALSAVVGRGGMLPPVKGGGYLVDEALVHELADGPIRQHASNLGGLLAADIARPLGIPAYIYDAVSTDEMPDIAKITGIPEIRRQSFAHVLNSKASARKAAQRLGGSYNEMNFLVAHMGGGVSISLLEKGRLVDSIADDAGPFSPERAGSVPLGYVEDMCYSGQYTRSQLEEKLMRNCGIKGLLGTNDCRLVEQRIEQGDAFALLVYQAFAYQIAKGLGQLAPVLCGNIDAIILTGGLAHSQMLTGWITRRVGFIAQVLVMPGENEMEALALGALRILQGKEAAAHYGQ